MISDMTAIGATGGALIGAATNAHSDLYKATGGIALTAMGLLKYANFKTQALATRVAASKLTCAKSPLNVLVTKAGLGNQPNDAAKASMLLSPGTIAELTMAADGKQVIHVMGVPTQIAPTDYLTFANVLTTYDNAMVNIDRATKTLLQLDEEATTNLVGLQLTVINEIENDSFKLDEAMLILRPLYQLSNTHP